MLPGMSDERLNYQWKIDEIILDALEGLDLSDEEAKAEFERIRILDEMQIEEELAKLEEAEKEEEEEEEGEDDEFDPLEYIASNPDLIAAFGGEDDPEEAATIHYIRAGFAEGRAIDEFDPEQYLDNYPDLIAAFGGEDDPEEAATIHYIEHGFAEGRTYEGPDDEGPDDEGPDEGGIEDEPLADAASAEWVPVGTATAPDFFL
jgi:hypothetical protein